MHSQILDIIDTTNQNTIFLKTYVTSIILEHSISLLHHLHNAIIHPHETCLCRLPMMLLLFVELQTVVNLLPVNLGEQRFTDELAFVLHVHMSCLVFINDVLDLRAVGTTIVDVIVSYTWNGCVTLRHQDL